MEARTPTSLRARAETWLWTGPAGHLLGGALDVLAALTAWLLARARGSSVR